MFKSASLLVFRNFLNSSFSLKRTFASDLKRTHYCGKLNLDNVGQRVVVCGWLQTVRFSNFLILRDLHGLIQINLDDEFYKLNSSFNPDLLTNESVLAVEGTVEKRPVGRENKSMSTGFIEIKCTKLNVLNEANKQLPFTISQFNRANETVRLQHRYLDLRFSVMQHNLILRSNFVHKVRQYLHANGFIDVETPTLFRRTPGGAREFIVPTKLDKQFYSLTQSPQQFKQLLMIAGIDKYYQIARCYRDESTKPDRQPEFTQIDLEMSFIDQNDCIRVVEELIQSAWPFDLSKITFPFQRMTFNDCIRLYGIDKPDLRFDLKFNCLTQFFKNKPKTGLNKLDSMSSTNKFATYGFRVPKSTNVNQIDLEKIEKEYRQVVKNIFHKSEDQHLFFILKSDLTGNNITKHLNTDIKQDLFKELQADTDDLIVLLASNNEAKLLEILGKYRLKLAELIDQTNKLNQTGTQLLRDPKVFKFLWVTDFPLFTINEETNKLESTHHPFTAPIELHFDWVKNETNLDKVTGQHYDLVLNGEEIAGGSIRIHDSKMQRHVLEKLLKEDTSQLEHLIKALEYGAPPHGGIALGLDRLCAIMCSTSNIRDVIAFPKSQNGKDLMASAPALVPKEDLDYYKIKCFD